MTESASEWVPAFDGQRPPFKPGNELRKTHGAYAMQISEPVEEKVAAIRTMCPAYSISDEYTIRLLAITLTRIERGQMALDEVDALADRNGSGALSAYLGAGVKLDTLRSDVRSWVNSAGKLLDALGLSTTSRAKLHLDVALAQRAADQALDHLTAEGRRIRQAREESS